MALKEIFYFIKGKRKKINVKICDTIIKKSLGLMFQKKSPPLLFIFNKNKTLTIHSFFCKPFRAIWLDEKMNITKFVDVKNWKLNISGKGKYLLEIPILLNNNKSSSIKKFVDNRNI